MTESSKLGSYEDGVAAAERGDFVSAVRSWRHVAEQGNAKAQYNMGVAYARGIGVPKDWSEAQKWWRWAAEQGHETAKEKIAAMGAGDGEEEPRDPAFHGDFLERYDPLTPRNEYAHWLAMVKKGPVEKDDWRLERLERARTRLGAAGVEWWWSDRLKAVEEAASNKASASLITGIMVGFAISALLLLFAK